MRKYLDSLFNNNGISKWAVMPATDAPFVKKPDERINSYIMCLIPYHVSGYEGNVAMYASFRDYHKVIPEILAPVIAELKGKYPDETFAAGTDTSALDEVKCAVSLRLGDRGLNNLLLNKDYGSYLFIAEIETSLKLERMDADEETDVCIRCGMCLKRCPLGAINPKGFDRNLCVSRITQKKGELTDAEKAAVINSEYVWGCDICQKFCPVNAKTGDTAHKAFGSPVPYVTEEMLDDTYFFENSAFAWRGKETVVRNIKLKNNN